MMGEWPFAAPDHGALKAEFEVFGGPEADLLDMHPGVAGIDHVGQFGEGLAMYAGLGI